MNFLPSQSSDHWPQALTNPSWLCLSEKEADQGSVWYARHPDVVGIIAQSKGDQACQLVILGLGRNAAESQGNNNGKDCCG